MARKKKEKIFNDRKRKVFRHYIGRTEYAFGIFFVLFVALMGVWFISKEDNYDPTERDISIEVLIAQQVEDHLYETPLKRWVDPSLVVSGVAAGPNWGPIPTALLGKGWTETSYFQEFTWDTLYEKIDGAEVQYKSYGFQEAYFLGLSIESEGLDFNVEMYDMTTFENALGLFWAQRGPDAEMIHEGNAYYYKTEVGAIGMVDRYYFKVAGGSSAPPILEQASLFIQEFEPTVEASGTPPSLYTLLAANLDFEDIGYIKQDAFQYEFCKDFWFGAIEGDEPNARFYLHKASDADAAAALFDLFYEEQAYEYEEQSREGNKVTFKHEFLDTLFFLHQEGALIYGIDGVKDPARAESALAMVETIVAVGV